MNNDGYCEQKKDAYILLSTINLIIIAVGAGATIVNSILSVAYPFSI
jgi:hypothetical protein